MVAARLFLLLSLALAAPFAPVAGPMLARAPSPTMATAGTEALQINTASGAHKFAVEVMRTDEARARGLMFRRSMPANRGMLFDFQREEPVMMWMKNTYISLDMVFIDRKGVVVSVAENAEPLSERTIPSGPPVYAVLELNAGIAAKIGLKPGDKVDHLLFAR